MESPTRVLCKFFLHGACLKGEDCPFSHSWSDQASQVCTFYQRGLCSYGSRCRYEHVKLSRPVSNKPLPPLPRSSVLALNSSPDTSRAEESSSNTRSQNAWQLTDSKHNLGPRVLEQDDEEDVLESEMPTSNDPSELPICAFAAAGTCTRGANCPQIHGDLCPTCGKHCLHPFRPSERDNHRQQCERNQRKLEALRNGQEIECSICLERVLSKPKVAERKFGLMSGCDHPFCVGCIRGWRSGSHAPEMDIDTVVRACPVCRVASHFVVPSVVWYSTSEEKEDIINGYKNKLSAIDCKYFDFGNRTCPFGTSCFYKHMFRDGTREEVKFRHLGAASGNTVIAKNVRLSDFLDTLDIRR